MKNLDRIRSEINPERRRKINNRAAEILAEEMTLRELRKALNRTQTKIGRALNIGQEGVSRIEQRTDLLLAVARGPKGLRGIASCFHHRLRSNRYWMASARCSLWIRSAPAKSAVVCPTLSTRS